MRLSNISIKDQLRYRDITWIMPSVNVEDIIVKLGSRIEKRAGKVVTGFCPDHHLFTGRVPSHPKWVVNAETGETFCFTEGRGSNLVWIVCRMMDCVPREAVKFLTGLKGDIDETQLEIASQNYRREQMLRKESEEKPFVRGLDAVRQDIQNRHLSERAYQFFIQPPGKKQPTNILPETVDRYCVFERTWGYYSGRVIIPFFMRQELVGFCALDIAGEQEWLSRHPTKAADDYRKILYPMNFQSGAFLFGFDDCQKNADFLVVLEGPREVMKLFQEGFPNSVAVMGSYLSDTHYDLITELAPKRVVLMFDGDDSGVESTTRIGKKLARSFPGDRVQKCFLPRGLNPKNLDRADFEKLISGQ